MGAAVAGANPTLYLHEDPAAILFVHDCEAAVCSPKTEAACCFKSCRLQVIELGNIERTTADSIPHHSHTRFSTDKTKGLDRSA